MADLDRELRDGAGGMAIGIVLVVGLGRGAVLRGGAGVLWRERKVSVKANERAARWQRRHDGDRDRHKNTRKSNRKKV